MDCGVSHGSILGLILFSFHNATHFLKDCLDKVIYTFIIAREDDYTSKTPSPTSSIFADYLYSTFGFGLESLK